MATDRPVWAPSDVAIDQPSVARIWDWFLGGSHNFAVDREVARRTLKLMPEGPAMARLSRAFLRRAVEYCARSGITQFIDLGSGIPTVGNVHEVAQRVTPKARVVYVDTDPVAVAHTGQILSGDKKTAVVQADLRDPEQVLGARPLRSLLDLGQPVALLMVMVLHFVPDSDDPRGILATYREALAPGSALVIAHGSRETEGMPTSHLHTARQMYEREVGSVTLRTKDEVEALFDGFDLIEPGVAWVPEWRPEPVKGASGSSNAGAAGALSAGGAPSAAGTASTAGALGESSAAGAGGGLVTSNPRAGYAGVGLKPMPSEDGRAKR